MKTKYYLLLLIVLLAIGFGALGIYYTQDFSEEINFVDSIAFSEIDYTSRASGSGSSTQDFLYTANAYLGDVVLENNGIFAWEYDIPKLIGCIEFENGRPNYIQFIVQQTKVRDYYSKVDPIVVRKGLLKKVPLYGSYNSNYRNTIPLTDVTPGNLKIIKIYEISEKEMNPFDAPFSYDSRYINGNDLCSNLVGIKDPIVEISIIA
jgi:hypothetical protein